MFGDDRMDDVEDQPGVFMDGHVAKADHHMKCLLATVNRFLALGGVCAEP